MKRISYNGRSIVTGNAITAALLKYTTTLGEAEGSVPVDVTVLEDSGETSVHTILLGPTTQLDVADLGGVTSQQSDEDEAQRFPVPDLPQIGISGTVEANGDARRTAEDFDEVMAEIDDGLGQ